MAGRRARPGRRRPRRHLGRRPRRRCRCQRLRVGDSARASARRAVSARSAPVDVQRRDLEGAACAARAIVARGCVRASRAARPDAHGPARRVGPVQQHLGHDDLPAGRGGAARAARASPRRRHQSASACADVAGVRRARLASAPEPARSACPSALAPAAAARRCRSAGTPRWAGRRTGTSRGTSGAAPPPGP